MSRCLRALVVLVSKFEAKILARMNANLSTEFDYVTPRISSFFYLILQAILLEDMARAGHLVVLLFLNYNIKPEFVTPLDTVIQNV